MSAKEATLQGTVLWLIVTCALPAVSLHKPLPGARKYHPAPASQADEPQLEDSTSVMAEVQDVETSFRFSRLRRYRRVERAVEVVETLCSRNAWHIAGCSAQLLVADQWGGVESQTADPVFVPPPVVPLRC